MILHMGDKKKLVLVHRTADKQRSCMSVSKQKNLFRFSLFYKKENAYLLHWFEVGFV